MGLFDAIAGQLGGALSGAAGNAAGGHGGLMDVVLGLVNNPQTGGLAGLVKSFQDKGLGEAAASWVGTGQNHAISGDQLQSVLGSEQVQAIAAKLGLSTADISGGLASLLPQVVDKLTPNGQMPTGSMLEQGLSMLRGFSK